MNKSLRRDDHDPRGHSSPRSSRRTATTTFAPSRRTLGGRLTDAGGSTDHKRDLPVERNHLICSSARFQPAVARYRLCPDSSTHPPPAGRAADHLRKQPRDQLGRARGGRTTPSQRRRSHILDADDTTVGCDLVSAYGLSTGPSQRRDGDRWLRHIRGRDRPRCRRWPASHMGSRTARPGPCDRASLRRR